MRRELVANRTLARHATWTALAAISLDWIYTCVYWLVLGRSERRTKKHAALRYFAILGQLSVEAAAIIHLAGMVRKVQS